MADRIAKLMVDRLWKLMTAVPGLLPLWAVFMATGLLFAQLSFLTVTVLAAVPALIFYAISQPLEQIFTDWYGASDQKRTGMRLNKPQGAFLPSGRDLRTKRQAAVEKFPPNPAHHIHYPEYGLYERVTDYIKKKSVAKWVQLELLSELNKLFRGLTAVASLIFVGGPAFLLLFYQQLRDGAFGAAGASLSVPMLVAIMVLGLIASAACFLGFVWLKFLHMYRVYKVAVELKTPAPAAREARH